MFPGSESLCVIACWLNTLQTCSKLCSINTPTPHLLTPPFLKFSHFTHPFSPSPLQSHPLQPLHLKHPRKRSPPPTTRFHEEASPHLQPLHEPSLHFHASLITKPSHATALLCHPVHEAVSHRIQLLIPLCVQSTPQVAYMVSITHISGHVVSPPVLLSKVVMSLQTLCLPPPCFLSSSCVLQPS